MVSEAQLVAARWSKADIQARVAGLLAGAGALQPIMDYLASTRGKLLRPSLFMWTYEACGEPDVPFAVEDALEASALFELIHMGSLVHDDIIDDSAERRGKPAAHVLWGVHGAILAGDYLLTRANGVALRFGLGSLVNQAIQLICEGEAEQDARLFDPTVTYAEYMSHISRKTAVLFGSACVGGASLALAPSQAQEAALRFGLELGCAFQIADDIADLTADPAVLGKPSCNDLRRGVMTLPLILALKTPCGKVIEDAFAKKTVDDRAARAVRDGCTAEGCVERAKEAQRALTRSARSRLECLPPSPARESLESLCDAVAIQ